MAGSPAAPATAAAEQRPSAKPRFDFYNILPEMEVVVPDEELVGKPPVIPPKPLSPQKEEPATKAAEAVEEKTASAPIPAASGNSYLLQVASFRTVADAERLKARLALLGIQAQIQQVTVNGKDTYHLKTRFLVQCQDLVRHYSQAGQLRADVTAEEAAMACYSTVVMPFSLFALGTGLDAPTTKALIRRNLQLVFAGIGASEQESVHDA